jgi:gliding motility-associated-like protein
MKKLIVVLLVLFFVTPVFGAHIKGGFFTYKYLGAGTSDPTKNRYNITLTVYMECSPPPSTGQLNNPINFSIFDGGSGQFLQNASVSITDQYVIGRNVDEPCITGNQVKCYYTIVVYNLPSIELAPLPNGYIISYQRCCRIASIVNVSNSGTVGNTWSIKIPGTLTGLNAVQNSSPQFQVNDTAIICSGNYFQYPFSAIDPNPGDSLSYYFCDAWSGGTQSNPAPTTADPPSGVDPVAYPVIPYSAGFSGATPLGSQVTIDPKTGLISGIAPNNTSGQDVEYVITICVDEFRQGIRIGTTRKELHVKIGNCNAVQASLQPEYVNCQDFNVLFSNATPTGADNHFWDFGVPGINSDTSNLMAPGFNYPDTGTYTLTLIVNRGGVCTDTSTSLVKVYPGFFPGFTAEGICATKPTQFRDTTRTAYGAVNSWSWNFGDGTTLADISHLKNPTYSYPVSNNYTVNFIVGSDKGCIDTVVKQVSILDNPPLSVPFRDTLICNGDTLQLSAIGDGSFSWSPNNNILNANTASPLVFPTVTTTYHVQLNDQGCLNNDAIQVRVVDVVTLQADDDKGICLTDSVQLGATTNGLKFEWSPASHFSNPNTLAAFATPTGPFNEYIIRAHIGHCSTTDTVIVRTSPYPQAAIGADTTVCFGTPAELHGSIAGTSFSWSPANTLTNANTLNPTARPHDTTLYILTVFDANGFCPKPQRDSILVSVVPRIQAFASRDTSVVIGQPLQLTAGGHRAMGFTWLPATGLNNPSIFNPVATFTGNFEAIRYKVLVSTIEGCTDSAFVNIKVFKTVPSVFVPTAFTPNGDSRNDLARPIAVGIKKIDYFRIYNRWGELVFETSINGEGWDGKIGGKDQGTNVYVWIVKAVDYLGKPFFDKGTVTLIR